MSKRRNWQKFKTILEHYNISKLYHFTDRENLECIIREGGLYSWADCVERGIKIMKPGGSDLSRKLDRKHNLQHFVRVSFTDKHPMMYAAMNEGRINDPIVLEIDPSVIYEENTMFSDMNATKNEAHMGQTIKDFECIHFESITAENHFNLEEDEQPYFQAEILVRNFIPLEHISNIWDFDISLQKLSDPQRLVPTQPYSSQVTETSPTAFVFMIDQSASMKRTTIFQGTKMTLADAATRIVNETINELLYRCVNFNIIRHYYDIAVIGYGNTTYSAWSGALAGRFFVTPEELNLNPYDKVTYCQKIHTRQGLTEKEIIKKKWVESRCDRSCSGLPLKKVHELIKEWIEHHIHCYPPTIINITDGMIPTHYRTEIPLERNRLSELTSLKTDYGNVLFYNIYMEAFSDHKLAYPVNQDDLDSREKDSIISFYYDSSLVPTKYNQAISEIRMDKSGFTRHVGMTVNDDLISLLQLMDIGTSTNNS